MKSHLLVLLFLISVTSLYAQQYATTDDGKRVVLNNDGTWKYIENNESSSTGYTYIGGEKYPSGQTEYITEDISVTIIKKPGQTMILFWEDCDEQTSFFNWVWQGKVTIYLEGGSTIILNDRKINGINNEDGKYQRYSCYYLTASECAALKKSSLARISYYIPDYGNNSVTYKTISMNESTLKTQLNALKL